MNGILIMDKSAGWTSHDVVARVRRILGERSVGHLGTLDPMATGILPLVAGRWTRLAQFYSASPKTYEGVIRFGFATDTYDAAGEPTTPEVPATLDLASLRELAQTFVGTSQQMPPPFSAKKIKGIPAYKLARQQKPVELTAKTVTIESLELTRVEGNCCHFSAAVSSGTYIRSIAHEMGQRLGCGAHLASLRRTRFAEFTLADAVTLPDLEAAAAEGRVAGCFIHPRRVVPQLPSVGVSDEVAGNLRLGRAVNLPIFSGAPQVKVFCGQTDLVAICTRIAGTLFQPSIVFPADAPLKVS